MPTPQSCGSLLSYQCRGNGTPVLLLHSSACTGGLWHGLIAELGVGYTFFTPDLAGYGRSRCDYLGEANELRDEADFIAPLLWEMSEPYHVIGHSFGGAVALAAALAWPERIKSLTLYEPTAFSLLRADDMKDCALFEVIASVSTDMQAFVAGGAQDRALGRFVDFWNGDGTWAGKPAAERKELARFANKLIGDFGKLFTTSWPLDKLAALPIPTLIMRGDRSPFVAQRVAEILARFITRARLRTVANVGHMAPVTHPGLVAPAINGHLISSDCPIARAG